MNETFALLLTLLVLVVAGLTLGFTLLRRLGDVAHHLAHHLDRLERLEEGLDKLERRMAVEASDSRAYAEQRAGAMRAELAAAIRSQGDSSLAALGAIGAAQKQSLTSVGAEVARLSETNEKRLEGLRASLEKGMGELRAENARKLEAVRATVEEKLQGVLEKRLGESFRSVSERLERVHRGLGEMQSLATGVGDLKRVLTNVKTRGGWGEVQLDALLDQVLSPEQYERNVQVRPRSSQRVDFALKLPGRNKGSDVVWLPIDSKFPTEDYQRLVDGTEAGDADVVAKAEARLIERVREFARDIRDKYVHPPSTTDFAILFLPTEGLYAEIVRRPELVERLQVEYRVVIAGPTVLGALLNSLQVGFRTLAIEQRSSEVWRVLGQVKAEFRKFGAVLTKVQTKLDQASRTISEEVGTRQRVLERKLEKVEELPVHEVPPLFVDLED